MTETEAKRKQCIVMNVGLMVNAAVTGKAVAGGVGCLGSACMMWRWRIDSQGDLEDDDGHCGLAGKS